MHIIALITSANWIYFIVSTTTAGEKFGKINKKIVELLDIKNVSEHLTGTKINL